MPSLLPDLDYSILNQTFTQFDRQFNDGLALDSLSISVDDLGDVSINDVAISDFEDNSVEIAEDISSDRIKKIVDEYNENVIHLNGSSITKLLKKCGGATLKDKRRVRLALLKKIDD